MINGHVQQVKNRQERTVAPRACACPFQSIHVRSSTLELNVEQYTEYDITKINSCYLYALAVRNLTLLMSGLPFSIAHITLVE